MNFQPRANDEIYIFVSLLFKVLFPFPSFNSSIFHLNFNKGLARISKTYQESHIIYKWF